MMLAPVCLQCGKPVGPEPDGLQLAFGRFCSRACARAFRARPVEVTCSVCGKKFLLPGPVTREGPPYFCSGVCLESGAADKTSARRSG